MQMGPLRHLRYGAHDIKNTVLRRFTGKRSLKEARKELWPRPKAVPETEPHFLFLVTPPNSGSTAIAKLLNTSPRTTLLHDNGEGQWLVPGLHRFERWDGKRRIYYDSVRAVWLNRVLYLQQCTGNYGIDTVIEKSPPNMVRIDGLLNAFNRVSLVTSNRDPYANVSSIAYRYLNFATEGPNEREAYIRKVVPRWIARSQMIRAITERHGCPMITYETFCSNPTYLIENAGLPDGVADMIDPTAQVSVKDYGQQGIVNHNDKQIDRLTPAEIDLIGSILSPEEALLKHYGYALR